MRAYLRATNVRAPREINAIDKAILRRVPGLLEVGRTRLRAPRGELLCEAEHVLYRLVEDDNRVFHS